MEECGFQHVSLIVSLIKEWLRQNGEAARQPAAAGAKRGGEVRPEKEGSAREVRRGSGGQPNREQGGSKADGQGPADRPAREQESPREPAKLAASRAESEPKAKQEWENKPAPKSELKPEAVRKTEPERKKLPESREEGKPAPAEQPEPKPEARPEPRQQPGPKVDSSSLAQAQPEQKPPPVSKAQVTPQPQPEKQPESKIETRPEPAKQLAEKKAPSRAVAKPEPDTAQGRVGQVQSTEGGGRPPKQQTQPVEVDEYFDGDDGFGPVARVPSKPALDKAELSGQRAGQSGAQSQRPADKAEKAKAVATNVETEKPGKQEAPETDHDFFDNEGDPFEKFERDEQRRKQEASKPGPSKGLAAREGPVVAEDKREQGFLSGPPIEDFDLDDEFDSPEPAPRQPDKRAALAGRQAAVPAEPARQQEREGLADFGDFDDLGGLPVQGHPVEADSFEAEVGREAAAKMEDTGRSASGFAGFKAKQAAKQQQLGDYSFDDEF